MIMISSSKFSRSCSIRSCHLHHASAFLVTALAAVSTANAQIVTDGSLGEIVNFGDGNATILQSNGTTSGANLFHSFSTFNVNNGATVEFDGNDSIQNVISRVTGGSASQINGILRSNIDGADFFFINPAGVTFGADGSVDVPASFYVSTARQLEFADGQTFEVSAVNPTLSMADPRVAGFLQPGQQSVIVMGDLAVDDNSNFTIVGSDVIVDGGSITASGGSIELHAADSVTIEAGSVLTTSTETSLVTTASASGSDVSWTESPTSGAIVVSGNNGTVTINGALNANGGNVQQGGAIKIAGAQIELQENAAITASGNTGGGNIEIGGGYQGASMGDGLANSQNTIVQQGAIITADAGITGNGGDIVVWAEETTVYAGAISATGGLQSGDGGNAEVSGKKYLGFNGTVDVTANSGETGTLLLDPDDVVIDAANGDDPELGDNQILSGDGGGVTYVISPAALAASVNSANTIVQAINSITQSAGAPVDLSGGSANSLTLETSTGDITFNDTFIGSGGALNVDAGGSVELNGTLFNSGSINFRGTQISSNSQVIVLGTSVLAAAGGTISLDNFSNNFGGSVSANGHNISIADTSGIELGDIDASGSLQVIAFGDINDGSTTGSGADINVTGTTALLSAGDITLDDATNNFIGAVSASGVNVNLSDINSIELADIDASNFTLNASSIDDGVTSGVGSDIDVSGTTAVSSSGNITLDDATNNFGGAVSASGTNVNLSDIDLIELADIDASGNLAVTAGGAIDDGAQIAAGADINVSGASTLISASNITLNDATNDFTGSVSASGTAVAIVDINDLDLEDVTADTLTAETLDGTLSVSSMVDTSGVMSLTASEDVRVGNVAAVTSSGEVTFNAGEDVRINGEVAVSGADLTIDAVERVVLLGADVSVNANAPASLQVTADDAVFLYNDSVLATTNSSGQGATINMNSGAVTVRDGSEILSTNTGSGSGGSIDIVSTGRVLVTGSQTRIGSVSDGAGLAGNVAVNATGTILVTGSQASIGSEASAGGSSGDVFLITPQLQVKDQADIHTISSLGTGGNVNISATTLNMSSSGTITSMASGTGNGGSVSIDNAGGRSLLSTGAAIVSENSGSGSGGAIDLTNTNFVRLLSGSQINSTTTAAGSGGDITVDGALVRVDTGSKILSDTSGAGAGGDIQLDTEQVAVFGAGEIVSSSSGSGNGGDLTVNGTTRVVISAVGSFIGTEGSGTQGTITINSPRFFEINGGTSGPR